MTKNKRKKRYTLSDRARVNRLNRARELRDIFNTLRKRYVPDMVDEFFRTNYFLQPKTVEKMIHRCDNQPVDMAAASIVYRTVMAEGFHL